MVPKRSSGREYGSKLQILDETPLDKKVQENLKGENREESQMKSQNQFGQFIKRLPGKKCAQIARGIAKGLQQKFCKKNFCRNSRKNSLRNSGRKY